MSEKVTKYLNYAKDIIMGLNVADYNTLVDSSKLLSEMAPNIPTIVTTEVLMKAGNNLIVCTDQLYEQLEILDKCMQGVTNITDNDMYMKMAMFNISSDRIMDFRKEKNAVHSVYTKYLTESVSEDEAILNNIVNRVDISEAYSYIIENENKINKFTIRLVIFLLSLPSEPSKEKRHTTAPEKILPKEHRRQLEILIERQKDNVIGASRIDISDQPGVQGMLVRYSLRPNTSSMTFDNLREYLLSPPRKLEKKIFGESKTSKASNGSKSGGSDKFYTIMGDHGLIIIDRSNTSPVEFDLRGLIDQDYIIANDLEVPANCGLTKKFITKYQTAVSLPHNDEICKPMTVLPGKLPTWRIIETINGGELYRVLAINGNEIIHRDQIIGLVGKHDNTNSSPHGLSTRCHQYNEIQSNIIIPQLFDEKIVNLVKDYDERISLQASPEFIASTITEKLLIAFDLARKDIPLINADRFRRLSTNENTIRKVLFEVLEHSLGARGRGSEEFMTTYLVRIDAIVIKFYKDIDFQLTKLDIPDRLFRENTQDEVDKVLYDMYRQMMTRVTNNLGETGLWKNYDVSLKSYVVDKKQAIIV